MSDYRAGFAPANFGEEYDPAVYSKNTQKKTCKDTAPGDHGLRPYVSVRVEIGLVNGDRVRRPFVGADAVELLNTQPYYKDLIAKLTPRELIPLLREVMQALMPTVGDVQIALRDETLAGLWEDWGRD